MPRPGERLGRYLLLERIGAGGMAEVFLARQEGPAGFVRRVAIKFVRPSDDEAEALQSLIDEARVAAQLQHPNIVQIIELDRFEDGFYLVMEFVSGWPLDKLLRLSRTAEEPADLDAIADLGTQLLDGLGYAHGARGEDGAPLRVVHRDKQRVDSDGDGSLEQDDCDDFDPDRSPDQPEICNGLDDDCDGAVPADETDDDGDGRTEGDPDSPDCDDADPLRSPDHDEIACNGLDDDCDDVLHPLELDDDADGVTECDGDCDDADPDRVPAEGDEIVCDGIDNDCDGVPDDGFDGDGDGVPGSLNCIDMEIDCDDADPTVHPFAQDGPEPADEDCNGSSDWPGGWTCSATGPAPPASLAFLLLLVLPRRKRHWQVGLLAAVALVLQGQVLVGLDDVPLIAVGEANDQLASPWFGGGMAVGSDGSLYLGTPWRGSQTRGAVTRIDLTDELPLVLTASTEVCGGAFDGRLLGYRVAVGDFNDDGADDLAAGSPGDSEFWDGSGVFFASSSAGAGAECTDRSLLHTTQLLGAALAVGDLDGDGIDDVVAGNPDGYGLVRFFPGGADFFTSEDQPGITSGPAKPKLGLNVALIDIDCDLDLDVMTGDIGSNLTFLVNDGGGWPDGGDILSVDHIETEGPLSTARVKAVGLNDYLGDGCADVLLGLPNAGSARGVVALFPGGSITPGLQLPDAAAVQLHGSVAGDFAGQAVVPVFWTTTDGETRYPDLLIGSPGAESADGTHTPGTVSFLASADIPWDGGEATISDIATWTLQGARSGEQVGWELLPWRDVDGDGRIDVVVSVPGYDQPDRGGSAGFFLIESAPLTDVDGDGTVALLDCDDGDPTRYPGADEQCDGLDNDCDGALPDDELDGDGDGFTACGDGDCDDALAARHPGAEEVCDGLDNDCDGEVPAEESDADEDGVWGCWDCDDADPAVGLGEVEQCDGLDNDCDGAIDNGFDDDRDGFTACAGDCNDHHPGVFPGAEDVPGDGLDNDCDGAEPGEPGWGCSCSAVDGGGPTVVAFLVPLLALLRRRR